jgi:hypothetical protein
LYFDVSALMSWPFSHWKYEQRMTGPPGEVKGIDGAMPVI